MIDDATFSAVVVIRHLDRVEVEFYDRSDLPQGVLTVASMDAWSAIVASLERAGEVLTVERRDCPMRRVHDVIDPITRARVPWPAKCCVPTGGIPQTATSRPSA